MAGGALKGFGGTFLTFGILLLLAGAAAAGFAYMDQADHEDESGPLGVGEDQDRSDRNEILLVGGAAAAGIGVILLILGVILLASGGTRARQAELRALTAPRTAAQDAIAQPPAKPEAEGGRKAVAVIVAVVGILVASVLVLALVGGDTAGSMLGLDGADDDEPESGLLGQQAASGRMAETVTVLGNSQSMDSSAVALTVPSQTGRVHVQVNWTAAPGGVDRLEVQLEVEENGAWVIVKEESGPSGVVVDATDERLATSAVRVRVFPGEDGASTGQDFELVATYYR